MLLSWADGDLGRFPDQLVILMYKQEYLVPDVRSLGKVFNFALKIQEERHRRHSLAKYYQAVSDDQMVQNDQLIYKLAHLVGHPSRSRVSKQHSVYAHFRLDDTLQAFEIFAAFRH